MRGRVSRKDKITVAAFRHMYMKRFATKWGETPAKDTAGRKALMDQIQTAFYKEVPVAKFGNEYILEVYNDHLHGDASYFDVRFWNTWVTR